MNILVGKWFISFKNKNPQWHGQVVSKIEDNFYLVKTYDFFGSYFCMYISHINKMVGWEFYNNDEESSERMDSLLRELK